VSAAAGASAAVASGLALAIRQAGHDHIAAPPRSPAAPAAPAGPIQLGGGVDSSASGGSGFFFGFAVLASLFAMFAPFVSRALRERRQPRTAAPFLLLLERPG